MYTQDYISNSRPVAIPAVSKFGCVRQHSTGEFKEQRAKRGYDGKPKSMKSLAAKEAKRQAARAQMEAEGWL